MMFHTSWILNKNKWVFYSPLAHFDFYIKKRIMVKLYDVEKCYACILGPGIRVGMLEYVGTLENLKEWTGLA